MFTLRSTALAAALLATASSSFAHISYGAARDFGTIVSGSNVTLATQTVTSNYGWADAADTNLVFNSTLATTPRLDESTFVSGTGTDDLVLGDSHKGRAFRLHLDSALTVTITGSARASSGLTPGFSVYQGLAAIAPFAAGVTSADHDFAVASQAWRTTFAQSTLGASYDHLATQGSWDANGNWCIGGDGDPAGVASALSCFAYVGSASTTVANGSATGSFALAAGDYTVFVGGNDLSAKSLADSTKTYALSLNVVAVPEPQTYALMLAGLGLIGAAKRRRQSA